MPDGKGVFLIPKRKLFAPNKGVRVGRSASKLRLPPTRPSTLTLERNPYGILVVVPNANPDENHGAFFKHHERIHQFHNSCRPAQRGRSKAGIENTRNDSRNISVRILWQRCFGMGSPPPARQRQEANRVHL